MEEINSYTCGNKIFKKIKKRICQQHGKQHGKQSKYKGFCQELPHNIVAIAPQDLSYPNFFGPLYRLCG